MSKYICEYCSFVFKNKYNLNKHIQKSKTCINKRSEICKCGLSIQFEKYSSHVIECKDHIIYSLKKTIEKREKEISSLNAEIQKLQEWKSNYFMEQNKKLEEKLDKSRIITINNPKINNNNTSNNNIMINENFNLSIIPDMSKSNLEKICHDKLTKNIVDGGDDRIAEFIVDNVFRSDDGRLIVRCTDPTRKTMTYTLDGKTQFYDIEGNKIKQSIQRGTHLYIVKYANTLVDYTNIFSTDEIFTYDKILKRICILTYGKGCGKLDKSERKDNGKVEYIRDILRNKGILKDDDKKQNSVMVEEKTENNETETNEKEENNNQNIRDIEEENKENEKNEENIKIIKGNMKGKAVLIEFVEEDNTKTKNIFDIDIPEEFLHDTDDIDTSYKIKSQIAKEKSKKNWDSYRLTEEEREKEIMDDD